MLKFATTPNDVLKFADSCYKDNTDREIMFNLVADLFFSWAIMTFPDVGKQTGNLYPF